MWYKSAKAMVNHSSLHLWAKFVDFNRQPLLLTRAYFDILQKDNLLAFLRSSPNFQIEDQKKSDCVAAWLAADKESILGIIKVNKKRCVLECLTKSRVEEGKKFLESSLKSAIVFRAYSFQKLDHSNMLASEDEEMSLEEYLIYYYEHEWIRTPLPTLNGKTPLESIKTSSGRLQIANLINSLEKRLKLPYDFNRLRCRLNIGCVHSLQEEIENYKLSLQEEILVMLDASYRLLRAIEKVEILNPLMSKVFLSLSQLIDNLSHIMSILENTQSYRAFKKIGKEIHQYFEEIDTQFMQLLEMLPQKEKVIELYSDDNWNHFEDVNNDDILLPLPKSLAKELMANWRASAEETLFTPNMDLTTVLQKQPIEWIEAIYTFLECSEECTKKKEYITAISDFLKSKSNLLSLVQKLPLSAQKLLEIVLEAGGIFPYTCLVECFGNDVYDGFYWREKPPKSIIGILRARGLLFVGRIKGKKHKVAFIPVDLRENLQEVLTTKKL